jgi:hypothetical protein
MFSSSKKSTEVGINISLKLCLAILDLLYVCEDEIIRETPIELVGASILVMRLNKPFVLILAIGS